MERSGGGAIQLGKTIVRVLIAILFLGIVGAYVLSFFGVLFVSGDVWLVGLLAFFATVGSLLLRKGSVFAKRPFLLTAFWQLFLPLLGFLVVLCVSLSLRMGAPEIGGEPALALRERYLFSSGAEVHRWRFVLVAVSFHFAWHLFGVGIALETWRGVILERLHGDVGAAPASGNRSFQKDLLELRRRASQARRGRLSLSHVKRIRRFVDFAQSSAPLVWSLIAIVLVMIVAIVAGLLPGRALGVPIGLAFFAIWLGLALDLLISIREREVLTSIWMSLWVAGVGTVTWATVRWVVLGG